MKMQSIIVFSILCMFFVLEGCASVQIVDRSGKPIPNHIVNGRLPSMDMYFEFALIHYYGLKEDDEYLDVFKYIDPYAKHVIANDRLQALVISVCIINPHKTSYQLLLHYNTILSSGETISESPTLQVKKLLYNGNLSRKEFSIAIPTDDGSEYKVWFEILDEEGNIVFFCPMILYEVV